MRRITNSCSRTDRLITCLAVTQYSRNVPSVLGACIRVPTTFTGAFSPLSPLPGMRAMVASHSGRSAVIGRGVMRGVVMERG